MPITPDTKDWTWVITSPCPDCGFDGPAVARADVPSLLRDNARAFVAVLAGPDAAVRPAPGIWSPLEYACHVRDVHRIFEGRLRLMLEQDDPGFVNWDQDATAVEAAYGEQDPAVVADELAAAAEQVAVTYADVVGAEWDRTGRRSNGSVFTVDTLARYHLHDVVHHRWDVRG